MNQSCLNEQWHEISLGEINIYQSQSVQPEKFPNEMFELWSVPNFPVAKPEIVSGHKIGSSKQSVAPQDVLICKINPRINRVWEVGEASEYRKIASSEWIVFRQPMVEFRFFLRFFQSAQFRDKLCSNVSGVGGSLTRAQPKKVANFSLPFPPLAEQKVIADKLDTLLVQVNNTKARLERIPEILKHFRQSVLAAAVSGRLTEEWRNENSVPVSSWKQLKVGDVSNVATGKTPSRKESKYWQEGEIPWLTSASTGAIYTNIAEQYVTQIAVNECSLKVFSPGTLLLAMYGEGKTRGQVTELNISAACNQACAAITAKEDRVLRGYLKLRLLENYEETRKFAAGGTQPNLNLNKVREIGIAVPSNEEQTEIVRRVDQLFAYADTVERQVNSALERVSQLTQSTLAKAFRGELTAQWRADNLELIRGDNSAKALLERIKAEREAIQKQPKTKRAAVKKKTGSSMSKQIIQVAEALKQAGEPLNGQQLLAAAGYPSDSSTEELEKFFLDIREALNRDKTIIKLERDDEQGWFALKETTSNE